MSKETHSQQECLDKDFALNLPHDALQKRIVTLGHESDLFLMLQIEPGYGERNQEKIIKTMAEGIYDDPSLRDAVFLDQVGSKSGVLPFLKGSTMHARLVNEYLQSAIALQLEKEAKRKVDYLEGYISARLRGNAIKEIRRMKVSVETKKAALTPELEKERERLIDKVDFAPVLQAELIEHLKLAPCVSLFKMFLEMKGVKKADEEIAHLIKMSVEHKVVMQETSDLLEKIKQLRKIREHAKKANMKIAEPRRETQKLTFRALSSRFEGHKEDEEAPKEDEDEKPKGRKRRDTMQGYLVHKNGDDGDGIPFMEVDELFEDDVDADVKPIPATKDAPAKKVPEMASMEDVEDEEILPASGSALEEIKSDTPKQSQHIPAKKVLAAIEKAEEDGLLDEPPEPILGDDDVPVLELDVDDYEEETFVDEEAARVRGGGEAQAKTDFESARTNVIPPIPGKAFKASQDGMYHLNFTDDDDAPVTIVKPKKPLAKPKDDYNFSIPVLPTPEPSPAIESVAVEIEDEKLPTLPTLPTIETHIGQEESRIRSWVRRHAGKILLAAGVVITVAAGYVAYDAITKDSGKKRKAEATRVAHRTKKDDGKRIQPPPMRRLDEPMKAKSGMKHASTMKQEPVMKVKVKPRVAVKPMVAKKPMDTVKKRPTVKSTPRVAAKPTVAAKPKVTPPPKTVNVKGVSKQDKTFVSIDKKTLKDLPDGIYKGMWAGESYDIQNAPFASVSGFMEQQLQDMVKTLPTKKAQREARRAYRSQLKQLERGWLINMSQMADNLHKKSMDGTITAQEDARLKWWEDYQKTHKKRKWQAKWLYNRYQKLKSKGGKSKSFAYYKNITEMGRELMEGLQELNPEITDMNNVQNGQKVRFTKDGKVLKTFWRFAHAMKLPMPEKGMGSTGELAPLKKVERKPMLAQHIEITDDMVVDSYTQLDESDMEDVVPIYGYGEAFMPPPPIPKDAKRAPSTPPPIPEDAKRRRVIAKRRKLEKVNKQLQVTQKAIPVTPDMFVYGAAPVPELKPILADMDARRKAPPIPAHVRDHKPLNGQTRSHDVYSEFSLLGSNEGEYEDFSVKKDKPKKQVKDISKDPMWGSAPLEDKKLEPILADMVKKSHNDYVGYSVEGSNGEFEAYEVSDTSFETVESEKTKKKSLWNRAKGWLKQRFA